jgi:ubiquinone/menaquinone biosynthesis C-methylase UbiE
VQINYDEISKTYDDVRTADLDLVGALLSEFPENPSARVLDFGCGTGNFTELVRRCLPVKSGKVCGIDPSDGMLSKARAKSINIDYRIGSSEAIPYEAETFDLVYMTDVIHHIRDLAAMFSEIKRALRPSGRLCIATQSHRQIERRPIAEFFPGTVIVDQKRYPDIDVIENAGCEAGLMHYKNDVLFENELMQIDQDYLQLVEKKGYSMLHLIPIEEYLAGYRELRARLRGGPITTHQAGETLVWFIKN